MSESSVTGRRSFLLAVGGGLFGPLALPVNRLLSDGTASTPSSAVAGASGSAVSEVIVRLGSRPKWAENDKGPFMIWMEFAGQVGAEPQPNVMFWQPETPDEWADANRFYEAAMWRRYSSFAELSATPRQSGNFVVRTGYGSVFNYLASTAESILRLAEERQLGPVDGLWTQEPTNAAKLTHDEAIRLTIRLQTILGEPTPDDLIYLEPVSLAEALQTHARFAASAC